MNQLTQFYFASEIIPSTRCKSFDAQPPGLKFNAAFIPDFLHVISIEPYCSIHILPTIIL